LGGSLAPFSAFGKGGSMSQSNREDEIDSVIQKVVGSLRDHALGDIKKASAGGSKMGAFILCSCLIDAMEGFIKGADTNGDDYRQFVKNYQPSYNGEHLYRNLRCKLVHSYSESGSYLFVDNKPGHHHKKVNGRMIINLENFIDDIENALKKFEINAFDINERELRAHFSNRAAKNGVIGVTTIIPGDPDMASGPGAYDSPNEYIGDLLSRARTR
jgi:hypothetical protein